MPGKEPTLFVTGVCSVPQSNYRCEMSEDPDSPTVGTTLVVRRALIAPEVGDWIMSDCDCRYERQTDATYTHVRILPDDVTVEVRETS